jgi:MFS transporter, DHA3 family, macrolide efflux protein
MDDGATLRLSVLWAKPFRWAFGAQTMTEIADQVFVVGLTWAMLASDHGLELGLVLTAWAAPRGVFLLFGGVLVDRADSRILGAASGAVLAGIMSVLTILYTAGATPLPVWLTTAVVLGLIDGVRSSFPTATSSPPTAGRNCGSGAC